MPDISMCANQVCPKREECFRYRATPSEFRQSFGEFFWRACDHFWPLEDATGPILSMEEIEGA